MKKINRSPENLSHFIDKNRPPVIYIESGERIAVETERADNLYLNNDPGFENTEQVKKLRVNPTTGPIYVNGATAEDLLIVKICDITLGDNQAFTSFQPAEGLFASRFIETVYKSQTKFFSLEKNNLEFKTQNGKIFTLDYEPMVGTIATAHADEVIPTLQNNKEIMGNVDCTMVKKGSEIVLPVNVPGALLSIGDVHARQGAGEPAGTAAECRGTAVVEIHKIRRAEYGFYDWPQVNNEEYLGSIAFAKNSLNNAVRYASFDLVQRLISMTGMSFTEATIFIGHCLELEVCQCTADFATVCAKVKRRYIQ